MSGARDARAAGGGEVTALGLQAQLQDAQARLCGLFDRAAAAAAAGHPSEARRLLHEAGRLVNDTRNLCAAVAIAAEDPC